MEIQTFRGLQDWITCQIDQFNSFAYFSFVDSIYEPSSYIFGNWRWGKFAVDEGMNEVHLGVVFDLEL